MTNPLTHIIEGCLQGDRKCQKALFDRYNRLLFGVAMKYMHNIHNAEEVVQDSWISIFKSLGRYNEEGKFEGWLKTIVIRTAWKALKKETIYTEISKAGDVSIVRLDKQWMAKMTCEEVLGLLDQLPPASRTVFKMSILDGYDHKEIANLLGINASTSRAHLAKARAMLKNKFNLLNKVSGNGLQAI